MPDSVVSRKKIAQPQVQRHTLVFTSLVLDALTLALACAVDLNEVLVDTSNAAKRVQRFLPALGAVAGMVITTINVLAFTSLIKAYAKAHIVGDGMSFSKLHQLHQLANSKIPYALTPLFIIGVLLLFGESFLPTVIVSSVTATDFSWSFEQTMPIVDFSLSSGVTPNIYCEYAADITGSTLVYGYGINCPIDYAYGEIYNAGLQSFMGTFPVNSTRNGVSYPSELLGLSGTITDLMKDYVGNITNDPNRDIVASDTFDTCLPRMVIDVTCSRELGPNQWFNMSYIPVPGGVPQGIVNTTLCDNSTTPISCSTPRYGIHFAGGTVIAFWNMDSESGNTTMSLYSFGAYATETGMTSPTIQCVTSAREEMVPIRITGGSSVASNPDLACPSRAPPSPQFLLNITRIADIAFIKMQGIDGMLEPISYVPNGTDRVYALSEALRTMVATGATEMYAKQATNSTAFAEYANSQLPYTYTTPRTRLGSQSMQTFAFVSSPIILIIFLLAGYIYICFFMRTPGDGHSAANMPFDPLHPASMAIAGLNRSDTVPLPLLVSEHSTADPKELENINLIVRYGYVSGNRLGLETSIANAERASYPPAELTFLKGDSARPMNASVYSYHAAPAFDASKLYDLEKS